MGIQQKIQEGLVSEKEPLLLFDGVCNLCNNAVQFVIKHDNSQSIYFASLQSETGKHYLQKARLPTKELKSLIFIDKGTIHTRSSGALQMSKYLNYPWKIAYVFILFPKPLRDLVYNLIAKNRYKWFGKKEECMIPTPSVKARFVDS